MVRTIQCRSCGREWPVGTIQCLSPRCSATSLAAENEKERERAERAKSRKAAAKNCLVGLAVLFFIFGVGFAVWSAVSTGAVRDAQNWMRPNVVTVGKSCVKCGKEVSLGANVGDRCPHCGVVWTAESQHLQEGRKSK
jgi:hypothetical protein